MAATPASNAWAVGAAEGATETLTARWDGATWKRVSSPNPSGTAIGRANGLDAVAATSVSSAWAAGASVNGGAVNNSFLVHWNGTAWQQAATPNPGFYDSPSGVAATSAANAWAVGGTSSGPTGIVDPALERHRLDASAQPVGLVIAGAHSRKGPFSSMVISAATT